MPSTGNTRRGDDTRFLDWKVYGKTDKLYVKQYQKETNLDLLVMVDISGSMSYASRSDWRKYDHAASLAAAMTYLALKQQDRVALSLFDDEPRRATRMSNRQGHWRSIVEALSSVEVAAVPDTAGPEPPGRTNLAQVFDRVVAKLARRSLIVLISDLFDDPQAIERGLARFYHRGHEVIVMQVLDAQEREFPFRSPAEFIGLEAEGRLRLDPAALRQGYLHAVESHLGKIEAAARKFMFDYLLLDTSRPLAPPLSHFLARRSARLARK